MKINKALILSIIALIILAGYNFSHGQAETYNYAGERALYSIKPTGQAEYHDLGIVDLNGAKVDLITFKTKALFFEDTEKIYSDPVSSLPIRVERNISTPLGKEYIIEEYDQKNFTIIFKKFKKNKLISEWTVKADGPVYNAITLPFFISRTQGFKPGWHFTARVPGEFKLKLVSTDKIIVPAGKFQVYHFKSTPDKFEIWINKDNPQIPLKIQGKGVFGYSLSMKEYSFHDNIK